MASQTHETAAETDEAYCPTCNRSFAADVATCPADGSRLIMLAAERDELIGTVLNGRYEIRSVLGKGGMGTVYRACQLSVDREVAVKVIHPKLSRDRSIVKRFLREARLASSLAQANIVSVIEFGQAGHVLYLVMELLRGRTLASELSANQLEIRRIAAIGAQLCEALEAAHGQGTAHRDLKPGNILILDEPQGRDRIKVLDFGLAKSFAHEAEGSAVTNTNAILGTPLYMAPEQIEGRPSDHRVDLYSLGCILYEMLSGAPPFHDPVVSAVLARHIADTPEPLPPAVPVPLRALIARLLEKDPAARVQTAGEVRVELEAFASTSLHTPPFGLRPSGPAAFAPTEAALATPLSMAQPARKTRRWIVLGGVVCGLAIVTFVLVSRGSSDTDATARQGIDAGVAEKPQPPAVPDASPSQATPPAVPDASPSQPPVNATDIKVTPPPPSPKPAPKVARPAVPTVAPRTTPPKTEPPKPEKPPADSNVEIDFHRKPKPPK